MTLHEIPKPFSLGSESNLDTIINDHPQMDHHLLVSLDSQEKVQNFSEVYPSELRAATATKTLALSIPCSHNPVWNPPHMPATDMNIVSSCFTCASVREKAN